MLKKISFFLVLIFFASGCSFTQEELVETDLDDTTTEVKEDMVKVDINESTSEPEVVDMIAIYESIPEEFKYSDYSLFEDEHAWIHVNDPDNYYLYASPSAIEGDISLTVFFEKSGQKTYAISTTGCGPLCQQSLYFLRKKDGVWTDATAEVFPELELEAKVEEVLNIRYKNGLTKAEDYFLPIYLLPQYGTSISMEDQYDWIYGPELGPLYEFDWDWETGSFISNEVSLKAWK